MYHHPSDRYQPEYIPEAKPRNRWLRPAALFIGAFVLGGLVLPNLHVTWKPPESGAQRAAGLDIKREKAPLLSDSESYAKAAQIASKAIVFIAILLVFLIP